MELSPEVVKGLNYLASGSYISEDNYKRIVNSSLGLLAGEPSVERVSTICPEKGEIIKQIYGCLLTFTVELIRNNATEEVQALLSKQNFKPGRIEYFIKVLNCSKDNITRGLENCQSGWPNIVDADWRLDYVIKSNTHNHIGDPLYYIVLTTEKDGKLDYIKFTCNLHQMQELLTKLKEIVCHIEKLSITIHIVLMKGSFLEIQKLRETICAASATITNLTCLNWEAAILSRILYKCKRIFRHDKAFQTLSKIHQSLKRYLKLNLFGLLEAFGSSLSEKTNPGSSHAYLPTRQMLKWLLLRLLASSRIFARVITLAKDTGAHLYKKLHLGWQVNLTLFAYSMTARILVTSKFLVVKLIEWYDSLHGCLPYLEETAKFVPEFSFPDSLSKWLGDVDVSSLRKNTSIDKMFEPVKGEDDDADFESDVEEVADEGVEEMADEGVAVRAAANAVEDLGVSVKEEEEEKKKKKEEEEFRAGKRKRKRAKWLEKSTKETEAGDRKWKKFRNR